MRCCGSLWETSSWVWNLDLRFMNTLLQVQQPEYGGICRRLRSNCKAAVYDDQIIDGCHKLCSRGRILLRVQKKGPKL